MMTGMPPKRKTAGDGLRGKVRPRDPFELIRWLAFSQPDPRKALAELVQNSLDARARTVRVSRQRIRGVPCLRVWDDGEGVIPESTRPDALRYIATNIGHSRKRNLSVQERHELMTQGQYGIGLLGFWSLGERLEMRSSVPGQQPMRLVLHRDDPRYEIEPLRGRLLLDERWTEVVVLGIHPGAQTVLAARRAADYLAAELRGQLLSRDVKLVYEDLMARGRGQKVVTIRPRRFLGEKLAGFDRIEVPGHAPIRLELHLRAAVAAGSGGPDMGPAGARSASGGDDGRQDADDALAVYAAGTLVARSFHELAGLGLDRAPWTDSHLSGMVDFPDLTVAPGSRRGVVNDGAAEAFARALACVEPSLVEALADVDRQRAEELDRHLIRDLQRAFRDLLRSRPRYEMLPVADRPAARAPGGFPVPAGPETGEIGDEPAPNGKLPAESKGSADHEDQPPPSSDMATGDLAFDEESLPLFPPGPLDHAAIAPVQLRVPCGGKRTARARALDADGRPIDGPFRCRWELAPGIGRLEPQSADAPEIVVVGADEPCAGVLHLRVEAVGNPLRRCDAEAPVTVVDHLGPSRSGEGIPAPTLVEDSGATWRSRWSGDRWEVNTAHRDYRASSEKPVHKLRYLAALFAKEIVLRSNGDPRLEKPLEQLVEVFSYADLRLVRSPQKRGKRE